MESVSHGVCAKKSLNEAQKRIGRAECDRASSLSRALLSYYSNTPVDARLDQLLNVSMVVLVPSPMPAAKQK